MTKLMKRGHLQVVNDHIVEYELRRRYMSIFLIKCVLKAEEDI